MLKCGKRVLHPVGEQSASGGGLTWILLATTSPTLQKQQVPCPKTHAPDICHARRGVVMEKGGRSCAPCSGREGGPGECVTVKRRRMIRSSTPGVGARYKRWQASQGRMRPPGSVDGGAKRTKDSTMDYKQPLLSVRGRGALT